MSAKQREAFETATMESIRQLLRTTAVNAPRLGTKPLRPGIDVRVQDALKDVQTICDTYREAYFEQANSIRVKAICSEFDDLSTLIRSLDCEPTVEEAQARVITCIKTWSHEARRWVADLPMQPVIRRLPAQDDLGSEARIAQLRQSWLDSSGGFFSPPPFRFSTGNSRRHVYFKVDELRFPKEWVLDPLDRMDPQLQRPAWTWNPSALLILLGYAKETLLLEADGGDRGGDTTFAQRRYRASLKDALAFSCIQVFERTIGPGTARQSVIGPNKDSNKPFERFVAMVFDLAMGEVCSSGGSTRGRATSLGPDPIRKAVATQRAWQRLFRMAGVEDMESFSALPAACQNAAYDKLPPQKRRCLKPAAMAWV